MKVIANSGPIIALAKLGLLSLLKNLYGTVVIPATVYHEVVIKGLQRGEEDAQDVNLAINLGHLILMNFRASQNYFLTISNKKFGTNDFTNRILSCCPDLCAVNATNNTAMWAIVA